MYLVRHLFIQVTCGVWILYFSACTFNWHIFDSFEKSSKWKLKQIAGCLNANFIFLDILYA